MYRIGSGRRETCVSLCVLYVYLNVYCAIDIAVKHKAFFPATRALFTCYAACFYIDKELPCHISIFRSFQRNAILLFRLSINILAQCVVVLFGKRAVIFLKIVPANHLPRLLQYAHHQNTPPLIASIHARTSSTRPSSTSCLGVLPCQYGGRAFSYHERLTFLLQNISRAE